MVAAWRADTGVVLPWHLATRYIMEFELIYRGKQKATM
jgi:hypothetical protein